MKIYRLTLPLFIITTISVSVSAQDDDEQQEQTNKITELLKANKYEECIEECKKTGFNFNYMYSFFSIRDNLSSADKEKINDLCGKQLVGKIKKLPLKKIKSQDFAEAYFYPYHSTFLYEEVPKNSNVFITGEILQNDGRTALMSYSKVDFIMKHSGQCKFTEVYPGKYLFFAGYGKYLGKTTYTTTLGAKQTVPAVQLLWCGEAEE